MFVLFANSPMYGTHIIYRYRYNKMYIITKTCYRLDDPRLRVSKGRFRMGWKVPLAPPQAGWSTQNAPPRSGREHSPNRRSNYMLQIPFISRKNASKRTKNLRKTPESSSNQLKMCSPSLLKSPPQMTESPSRTGVEHCGGLLPLVPFRMGWVSTPF